jgi:superfamily II DNA or RNA helicase
VIATNLDPPPEDRLFASLIDLRQDIAELRKHMQSRSPASDEQVVENLLRAEPAKGTDELKEALRRAKEITGDLSHDRPVSASKQEISQLIQRLEMLKHRVEVPLREFQEKLAEHALLATLAAVAAHRHLIGHIYQPTGSGLTTTALEYLRQVLSHDRLRDFTIIVATDRAMLIEQLYQRISLAEFLRARRVQRVTRADLTPARLRDPSSILVTTTQALRAARFPGSAPEKTLVIVFDLDLNQPTMMTSLLTQRYVISFTNSVLVSGNMQGNLIASYSLRQAQQDGVLVPLTFEFRPLTPDDSVLRLPPGFDVIEGRQDIDEPEETCSPGSSAWTESRVRAISEDIVEHFKNRFEGAKAVVIVSGIADALRFAAALRNAFFEDNGNPDTYVAVLNSAMPPEEAETVMRCFASREAHPSILVCGRTWMGVDLAAAHCAYLTCRLSSERFWKLAGQLCARVDGKRQATIVDYVGNSPSEFLQTGN